MKLEQIAYTGPDIAVLQRYFDLLGAKEWSRDVVTAEGTVFGKDTTNVAELFFNYDLGFELELLRYIKGDNWLIHRPPARGIHQVELSHMGTHVTKEEMEIQKAAMKAQGIKIAQEVYTTNHINPATEGKKYHYVVFDSALCLGFDLKLIERIMPTTLCEKKHCTRTFDIKDQECTDCMREARNGQG